MTELSTKNLSWSDRNGFHQSHVVLDTGVKALDKAGASFVEEHAAYKAAQREHEAAQAAVATLADERRAAAAAAGMVGEKVDKKAFKKKRAAAEERAEDAETDWITAESRIRVVSFDYLEVLAHHAPALAAQARAVADAGILELASALGIARRAEAKVTTALGILGALPTVLGGDGFAPRPPKVRKTTADDFNDAGSPTVHAQQAVDELTKAIGFSQRILDDLATEEKDREKAAKLAAEADASEDLDEDEDDDEGDD